MSNDQPEPFSSGLPNNEIDWRGHRSGHRGVLPAAADRGAMSAKGPSLNGAIDGDEVAQVLGTRSWSAETLLFNPSNGSTRGVWRVTASNREPKERDGFMLPDSVVLKLITPARSSAAGGWQPSLDPRAWNYWRREAEVYQSDLPFLAAECGLAMPTLLDITERSGSPEIDVSPQENVVSLWLEDVQGVPGERFSLAQHAMAAEALGRFHGLAVTQIHPLDRPWASHGFLRDYSEHRNAPLHLLEDDSMWGEGLVAETLGEQVREAARVLVRERESLLTVMEGLPRVFSHLDFWPQNLILRGEQEQRAEMVAVDWSFCGDGALGEDLGNYIPDCVFDHFVAADDLGELDRLAWQSYRDGLADAGWQGDENMLRLGVCASAIKYHWLIPLMLDRLRSGEAQRYGGGPAEDWVLQFEERGKAILFLAGWVEEAKRLAFP